MIRLLTAELSPRQFVYPQAVGPLRIAMLVTMGVVACGGASEGQLRNRAAFDLDCRSDQLEVVEIDGKTRGVTGCGRRNTYVEDCEREEAFGARAGCTWVLNVTKH